MAVLIGVGLLRQSQMLEMAQFALILTVAAIPVAMPAVLSVTMAAGALALSRMKAIVTRLESIEELAGMTPLSVIVRAVEEARRIFSRMTAYTIYRITAGCWSWPRPSAASGCSRPSGCSTSRARSTTCPWESCSR